MGGGIFFSFFNPGSVFSVSLSLFSLLCICFRPLPPLPISFRLTGLFLGFLLSTVLGCQVQLFFFLLFRRKFTQKFTTQISHYFSFLFQFGVFATLTFWPFWYFFSLFLLFFFPFPIPLQIFSPHSLFLPILSVIPIYSSHRLLFTFFLFSFYRLFLLLLYRFNFNDWLFPSSFRLVFFSQTIFFSFLLLNHHIEPLLFFSSWLGFFSLTLLSVFFFFYYQN